jgi:uncharacterized membrane protein (UPF0127 family)
MSMACHGRFRQVKINIGNIYEYFNRKVMYKTTFTAIFVILATLVFASGHSASKNMEQKTESQERNRSVIFRKKGTLIFINRILHEISKRIEIEVADSASEKNQGLMNRTSMPDSRGMLFVLERFGPRSMWMKNTHIPLDVIYVNDNYEVISIQKYNKPLSTKSIISRKDAMYMIEVSAGFCDRYQIREGDRVRFSYL